MFSNQIVSQSRGCSIAIGLAITLLAAGCSSFHSSQAAAPAPAPVPVAVASEAAPADEGPQTVTEALGDLQEGETAAVIADTSSLVKPSAPRSYVVKRGDTLASIANYFKTTVSSLRTWNPRLPGTTITPGQRLTVYRLTN